MSLRKLFFKPFTYSARNLCLENNIVYFDVVRRKAGYGFRHRFVNSDNSIIKQILSSDANLCSHSLHNIELLLYTRYV